MYVKSATFILALLIVSLSLSTLTPADHAEADASNATYLLTNGLNDAAANADSTLSVISDDGRYVAYMSSADNLVPNDSNQSADVFVTNRSTGATVRVSIASDGTEANDASVWPDISADGRFITFESLATNLIPNDSNFGTDIFVHDRDVDANGIYDEVGFIATTRVSVSSEGVSGLTGGSMPAISPDGRWIVFSSDDRLAENDNNADEDVFVHDRQTAQTVLVSIASDGTGGNDQSGNVTEGAKDISADGRFVVFGSQASNLVPNDTNQCFGASCSDIFVHDRDVDDDQIFDEAGEIATERVSVSSAGIQANAESFEPQISDDGRFVSFASRASNLVADDVLDCFGRNCSDIFLHDRQLNTTIRVRLKVVYRNKWPTIAE